MRFAKLTHAIRRDAAKTVAALDEAFAAGLTEINQIAGDDYFAFLREAPEFQAMLAKWRNLIEPSGELEYDLQPHPADAIEFGGRWYKAYEGAIPWQLAQLRCREAGGYLACINNAEEASFVAQTFPQGELWLGGVLSKGGRWRWLTGESIDHTSWLPGEPGRATGRETCIKMGADGLWRAAPLSDPENRGDVCEWER